MGVRKALAISLAAAVGLAGAGCAVDQSTASKDTVTIACGAMEEWCKAQTDAFTQETGIKATFNRLSSGETVARLSATKDNPEFDVWHGGPADGYGAAAKQGLIEKYVSPAASDIPAEYKDPEGYWAGVYVGVLGFCSNSKTLKEIGVEAPTSWEDLLNPKLKGQISTAHPSTSGTAFTTLWTQVERLGSEDAAMGYMKKMHSNVLQYTKSGTAPGQVAGRGEAAVGLVFSHDCVLYKERGMKDLQVTFPKEGTGYEIGGVAVIKGAKNADGAKKYVDWALGVKSQELGPTVGSYQLHTNPKAAQDDRMANLSDIKLVNYNFEKAAAEKKKLTSQFDTEVAAQPKS